MLQNLTALASQLGLIFCALAIGASWVAAIAAPNCSFEELDGSRADRHVRELLNQTAIPIAGMMLAAGALFLLATSWAAGGTAFLAAFGFYATRMMLAPKQGKAPPGHKTSRKGQRAVSVSLSLMFMVVAVIAAILGMVGI
ncbi:MAG: hypothetical protein KDA53_07005 [Hyphomonas sp.]|nr:hypothetical protein [Hyphomonas sp.]